MRRLLLIALATAALATGCTTKGNYHITWTITQGGAPATCADVGATKASFLSTLAGGNVGNDDQFNCADGDGFTDDYEAGTYTVSPALLDSGGGSLSAGSTSFDVEINAAETTEGPLVVFAF